MVKKAAASKKSKSPKKAAKASPAKKVRAKKDKDAPKRALSAFLFFSQDKRQGIMKIHPDWRVSEVASELGRQWGKLTASDKKPYEAQAAKDKERYAKAKAAYEKKTGK